MIQIIAISFLVLRFIKNKIRMQVALGTRENIIREGTCRLGTYKPCEGMICLFVWGFSSNLRIFHSIWKEQLGVLIFLFRILTKAMYG